MKSMAAISVKNVSKKYRLFNSPRERFIEALHPFKKKYHREFWALKGVSFEVPAGVTAGIIGRNGSGKSTLLSIISSVLKPSEGAVTVNGRVFALLELGAGFNPMLTGRENVFLKGVILGISKDEMRRRLPDIEAFADIGDFIDQPVRVYSSGMFVRLAFATAINVDPDILIIDEALAVGDAKFQRKCFARFHDFQREGKTILFVSHSTDAVIRHCDTALLLEGGRVVEAGEPKAVVNSYYDLLFAQNSTGYAPEPLLVEEGYRGFNIVHAGARYYAFSQTLGAMDAGAATAEKIEELTKAGLCAAGGTAEEVRRKVNDITSGLDSAARAGAAASPRLMPAGTWISPFDAFLESVPACDVCRERKSYNKNESRRGDGRAEILDYLVVSQGELDPVAIRSGAEVDIYMKVRFSRAVQYPMFGFAVMTTDGVIVYGTNTRLARIGIGPAQACSMATVKWSLRLDANIGDVFINLGVAEQMPDVDDMLDDRKDLIHLHVHSDEEFVGLARFETEFQEFPAVMSAGQLTV